MGYTIACISESCIPGSFQQTLSEFCVDNNLQKCKVRTPNSKIIQTIALKPVNLNDLDHGEVEIITEDDTISQTSQEVLQIQNIILETTKTSSGPIHTARKQDVLGHPSTSTRDLSLPAPLSDHPASKHKPIPLGLLKKLLLK